MTMREITNKLFLRRRDVGLYQHEIAPLLGVTNMQMSHFERGTRTPSMKQLEIWANALGMILEITLEIRQ